MRKALRKSFLIASTALSLSALSYAAHANPLAPLPVQNLTFTQFNAGGGLGVDDKRAFTDANPIGWTGGGSLVAIDGPGTAGVTGNNPNYYYGVYGPFLNPPPGGNFIQADGNPDYESSFNQQITGLTIGKQYSLSFWQAAGQQGNPCCFSGDTTEQWKVFFADTVLGGTPQLTDLMSTPSQGTHGWEQVNLTLTADATSEYLSFLAWGDGGSTANLPPTVFLAGVNTPAPEPAALSLLGVGLLGLGMIVRRRRGNRSTSN